MIDIKGLDKAQLLAALFNASKPLVLGYLHPDNAEPMSISEAQKLIESRPKMHFDYVRGRVMKVWLGEDNLDPSGYDRDNGQGAAAAVVQEVRVKKGDE